MLVSSAKLEADELRQERDAMGARLAEATEEAQRATRHRAKVEEELVRRHLLAFGRDCFVAWKGVVQAEQRWAIRFRWSGGRRAQQVAWLWDRRGGG